MRVMVVGNVLAAPTLDVWDSVAASGVETHLVGSVRDFGNPLYVPGPRVESLGEISVHPVMPSGWRTRGHLWWVYPELAHLAATIDPDVVHVLSEAWGLLVLQALQLGRPVVAHGSSCRYDTGSRLERLMRRKVLRYSLTRIDGFAGATPLAVEEARRHGLPSGTPTVAAQHLLPHPSRFDETEGEGSRPSVEPRRKTVGFVGRIEPEKGLEDLVRAAAKLRKPPLLVIAGEGSDRRRITDLAEDLAVPTRWLGRVPPDVARQVLADVDVVAVPSRVTDDWEEHFGRVALEAMLAGTPVVVTTSGFLPSLVGKAGAIADAGDVDALYSRLRKLLEHAPLRESRAALARRRAVSEFHPDDAAAEIVRLWRHVIGHTS